MGATIDEIIDSLKRGQGKRVSDLVKMALEEGTDPQMILEDGFLAGMEQVADKFRKEEVGVPEILSVTRALERGVSTLAPLQWRTCQKGDWDSYNRNSKRGLT